MLVLEQCLGTQPNDDQASHDSKATVLLAMSDLLYERFHLSLSLSLLSSGGKLSVFVFVLWVYSGNSSEAIERLKQVMSLTLSSLSIRGLFQNLDFFFRYVLSLKVVESETVFCCVVVAVEALVGLLIQLGQVQIPTVLNI